MESERYSRGAKPADRTGPIGKRMGMRIVGDGKIASNRGLGDMPPNASQCADAMTPIAPGCVAGKVSVNKD